MRTRNNRLAAIHSLFAHAALRHPEHAALIQRVSALTSSSVRNDTSWRSIRLAGMASTVARLGVTGRLRQSLTNTNCTESMISICRTTTGPVKRWNDGEMKKRWIAAGMLEAKRSFRRLKGHADMPALVTAIHPATVTHTNYAQVA